jgi:hypothetical protein
MGFFKATPKQKMQSNVRYNVKKARVAKDMAKAFPAPKPAKKK